MPKDSQHTFFGLQQK